MGRLWSRANRRPLQSKAQTVKLSHFLPLFLSPLSRAFVELDGTLEVRNGISIDIGIAVALRRHPSVDVSGPRRAD
jgi:hypothetical protein